MRPGRPGMSKAVPLVVSAGLAVGVFCGLLFGLGTGKDEAVASPPPGNNVKVEKADASPTKGAAPKAIGTTTPIAPNPVASSGAGSATAIGKPAAGAGSAVARTVKLTVQIKPDSAASIAKIQIDGTDINGTSIVLPADKKSVKVSVNANGFHAQDKKVDLTGDAMILEMELVKRSAGGGGTPASTPGGNSGGNPGGGHPAGGHPGGAKKPPSGGGLIDI